MPLNDSITFDCRSNNKITPKNINNWKKHFLENASTIFDKDTAVIEYKAKIIALEKECDTYAKTLGKVVVERDWAVGKLKSLDLSLKRELLKDSEAIQALDNSHKPSRSRMLDLIGMSKTAFYYTPIIPFHTKEDLEILNAIDAIYTKCPFYGVRRIKKQLERDGIFVGKKKIRSAMNFMNIKAIYQEPKTTVANKEHKKYPYLLKQFKNNKNQVVIETPNKVWSTDITYIKLEKGFVYLAAVIDWNTKKILSWKLSNTMDTTLTTSVLQLALSKYPKPDILNTDQGSQYTANEHVRILTDNNIAISMDGKGRSIDNIVIERFWRTIKYEDIYLNGYETIKEAKKGIGEFITFYNEERLHSSIEYETPDEVYLRYLEEYQKNGSQRAA